MYDPIGLVSPACLLGKLLYREICDLKLPWDETVPLLVKQKWERWNLDVSNNRVKIPRSIPTTAAAYLFTATLAAFHQPSGISQNLIASTFRLSKSEITTPRLEIIATHMSSNLGKNIRETLKNFNVRSAIGWTDSTVVLYRPLHHNRNKRLRSYQS